MEKRLVATLVICAMFTVISPAGVSADTNNPVPSEDGSWEMCGEYVCFTLFEGTFYDYTINQTTNGATSSFPIFDSVRLSTFQLVGNPSVVEGSYLIQGESSTTRAYDIPTGIMSFQTEEARSVSFQMIDQMGVILSDNSAVIGYGDFRGDLVLKGSGRITRDGQQVSMLLQPGDSYYFRAWYMYTESLGPDISAGRIGGELYLRKMGDNLISSVISYDPIRMEIQFSSDERLEVIADSSIQEAKSIIMTIDNSALNVPLDELKVELDGTTLERAESVREVISATKAIYFPLQSHESTQLFIHIPHFSQRVITISKAGPERMAGDFYLGGFASILLVVVAAIYLFRRRD